jgi:hypothetical protein
MVVTGYCIIEISGLFIAALGLQINLRATPVIPNYFNLCFSLPVLPPGSGPSPVYKYGGSRKYFRFNMQETGKQSHLVSTYM